MRKLMLARLVFLAGILVAVFALHVSGTALAILHIARLAVIGLVILAAGRLRARRAREHPDPDS